MGGEVPCDLANVDNLKLEQAEWLVGMIGATIFVLVSKVTLLLSPLMKYKWYAELMTYLMALAMGTMLCVTIFQLIPEALDLLHEKQYRILCGEYTNTQTTTTFYKFSDSKMKTNCKDVCNNNVDDNLQFCTLYVGGPTGTSYHQGII